MKLLIFLVVLAAVAAVLARHMKKTREEAERARLKAIRRRKEQEQQALKPQDDTIWPVVGIVHEDGEEGADAEPSMATIEYVPPGKIAS